MKITSFKDIAIFLCIALLIVSASWVWLSPSTANAAPKVVFNTLEGETISLTSRQGKPTLVVFWATTCVSCIKEMPELIELHHDFSNKGLEIIGVSMDYDPPKQVTALVKAKQLPYPITMDINGKIAAAFGQVRLTPTVFLIDPTGKIAMKKIGPANMKTLRATIAPMLNS